LDQPELTEGLQGPVMGHLLGVHAR